MPDMLGCKFFIVFLLLNVASLHASPSPAHSSVARRLSFFCLSFIFFKKKYNKTSFHPPCMWSGFGLFSRSRVGRVAASVFFFPAACRGFCLSLPASRCDVAAAPNDLLCVFHISQIRAVQTSHSSRPVDTNQFPVFRWRQSGGADDTDLKLWPNKEAHSCRGQWRLYSAICCTYCRLGVSCGLGGARHVQLMNGLMKEFLILYHKSPLKEASGFCDSAQILILGIKKKKQTNKQNIFPSLPR